MSRVELINMEFFAYHGCFKEEQIIGNNFLVSFWADSDSDLAAITDNIEDALNYQEIYKLIKIEMEQPSKLMESVAKRVLVKIKEVFPQITAAQISISKLNPPIGGKVEASRVVMSL